MLIDISQLQCIKNVHGIIHIGAHDCEERLLYLNKFHNITDNEIIWIDALKHKVELIKNNYPTIRIFNECISNTDGESILFKVTNNYQSSSILNLKEHKIEHPDIYEIEQIEMKTKTLKSFYNENNFSYDQFNFMALDIQGAELLALQGAGEILDSVDYIYLEVNTKELYEKCGLINDIETHLQKYNFQRQIIKMTDHGWGDAFYVKNKTQNNLHIMSIFKNETMNLKVWLDHYLWQGVQHFYLIDNGSTDNPLEILQYYIDNGIVTYYYRPEKHQQPNHYRYVFDEENLKEKTQWLCICDLDEFFFGTDTTLLNTLNDFNNFDVIYTNSYFYGSDNLIEHPKDIRKSIIHRTGDLNNGIKYIFKPSCINDSSEIWIHWLVHSGTTIKKILNKETFDNKKIRLNHYSVQSLEYYKSVKMTRGDVSVKENETMRDLNYFHNFIKDATIKDDILKQLIENSIYEKNGQSMIFYNENNNVIDPGIEGPEQLLVKHYINETDIVLELGARYGSVSCTINKNLKNKYNQVSVEPDESVWNALELNKIKNNCNFNIVKGFISNKKLDLILDGYGSSFILNENTKIPSYSLDEIKKMYNISKFNVLVADCEGFLEEFLNENPNLYDDLKLIMFEADYQEKCNYEYIETQLVNNNFINILKGHQNIWIKSIFKLSNNIKFRYGTKDYNVDVTKKVLEKFNNNNILSFPDDDVTRANILGDPLFGIQKSIYVYDEGSVDNIIYEIYHNKTTCIDLNNNMLYINKKYT